MSILSTASPSVHAVPAADHASPSHELQSATLARSSAAWNLGYNAARSGQSLALAVRWGFRESDRLDIAAGHRAGLLGRSLAVLRGAERGTVVLA